MFSRDTHYLRYLVIIPFIGLLVGYGGMTLYMPVLKSRVPDVRGCSLQDALARLRQVHLYGVVVRSCVDPIAAAGIVLGQNPPPDTLIRVKQEVGLTVTAGPTEVAVPQVTGLSGSDAVRELEAYGLRHQVHELPWKGIAGRCIAQCPGAGNYAPEKVVHLYVSKGPETRRIMPDFQGKQLSWVQAYVATCGLRMTILAPDRGPSPLKEHELAGMEERPVVRQSPLPGTIVDLAALRAIWLVLGTEAIPG